MNRIIYWFFLFNVRVFQILPFRMLYILSDMFYLLVYYIIRYRKKVVFKNLTNSFPEHNPKQTEKIAKRFYRHFCDITVESIKGFTMSRKQLLERYKVLNSEVSDAYFSQGKSIIQLASHYCNWEWGILSVGMQFQHETISLYKQLKNQYVEKYAKKQRERFGMKMLSIYDTRASFEENKETPVAYIMAADQSPSNTRKAYWLDFLNQDTACLHGPENYSRMLNMPVVYFNVKKVKRGFYTLQVINIESEPANTAESEITRRYMQTLEKSIKQQPEYWLWSHKRWKRNRPKPEDN